jgi:hypothetical protein
MNLSIIRASVQKVVSDNATGILTTGGAVGVVVTAVLASRASFKAAEIIRTEQTDILVGRKPAGPDQPVANNPEDIQISTVDKIKLVWPQYVPVVVTGAASIVAIVMANRLNAQRVAALAAAYSLSENRLKDYQAKVAEKLTGPKNQAIYDELAQEKVHATPPSREVMILGGRDVLCFDMFTGRYFTSTMEDIKKAELTANSEMFNHQYVSLSFFYDELGLAPTSFSDDVGWNQVATGPVDLRFSTVMSPDDKPCIAVDFAVTPQPNYSQSY